MSKNNVISDNVIAKEKSNDIIPNAFNNIGL
jgi:hypothetical protein